MGSPMPVSPRLLRCLALIALALAAAGCGGQGIGALLDPTRTQKDKGFDNGVGGGQVVKAIFPGARFKREVPTIIDFQPSADVKDVNIRTVIAIAFSESIDKNSVTADSVVLRESGSGTPITVEQIFLQSQTVLVLSPGSNLKENTSYEVVVSSSVEDLQGQKLDTGSSGGGGSGGGGSGGGGTGGGGTGGGGTGGGGSSGGGGSGGGGSPGANARFTFKTGTDGPNTQFSIVQVSPITHSSFGYELASCVVALNEPVVVGGGGNALDNPNNFIVTMNGTVITGKFQSGAGDRVVEFDPDLPYIPGANIKATLKGKNVESQNGRKFANGADFSFEFKTFETQSPTDILFPDNHPVTSPIEADGFISTKNLNNFPTDVTFDGKHPDQVTLIFLDPAKQNGLVFTQNASSDVQFSVNLQPESASPALTDGPVLVGAYATLRGQNGAVDVVKTLLKDTAGFDIDSFGPPSAGENLSRILVTPMKSPAVYGEASNPLGAITITLAGGNRFAVNILDFGDPLVFLGQGSFPETGTTEDNSLANVFITSPFDNLGVNFDPVSFESASGFDGFGNSGSTDLSDAGIVQVGVVGGKTSQADATGGMIVTAIAEDTFQVLDDTDIIVETFPPLSGPQTRIIKRVPNASFLATELSQLAGDLITVTLLRDGYHLLCFQGLPNPSRSGKKYGIQAILEPANVGATLKADVTLDNPSAIVRVSSNVGLTQDPDSPFYTPDEAANIASVNVRPNRLKAFSALADVGNGKIRLATKVPIYSDTAATVPLDLNSGFVYDNTSKSIQIVTNLDSASLLASRVYVDPVQVNLSEGHIMAILPGFPGALGMAVQPFDVTASGTISIPQLLPRAYTVNNVPDPDTLKGGNSDLELMIQPSLSDPDVTVSPKALSNAFITELQIRNGQDGRESIVRSQIDFTNLTSPVVPGTLQFPVVPNPVTDPQHLNLAQPPLITMEHTLSNNSVYRMSLIHQNALVDPEAGSGPTYNRHFDVLIPPGVGADPSLISVQYPDLKAAQATGSLTNSVSDFADPGSYLFGFQGWDFTGGDTTFTFSKFMQSQIDRDFFKFVRFKNDVVFNTF
jgi:hypothetical protein